MANIVSSVVLALCALQIATGSPLFLSYDNNGGANLAVQGPPSYLAVEGPLGRHAADFGGSLSLAHAAAAAAGAGLDLNAFERIFRTATKGLLSKHENVHTIGLNQYPKDSVVVVSAKDVAHEPSVPEDSVVVVSAKDVAHEPSVPKDSVVVVSAKEVAHEPSVPKDSVVVVSAKEEAPEAEEVRQIHWYRT